MNWISNVCLLDNAGAVLTDSIVADSGCHTQIVHIRIPRPTRHWIAAHRLWPHTRGNKDARASCTKRTGVMLLLLLSNLPMNGMRLQRVAGPVISKMHRRHGNESIVLWLGSWVVEPVTLLRPVVRLRLESLLAELNDTHILVRSIAGGVDNLWIHEGGVGHRGPADTLVPFLTTNCKVSGFVEPLQLRCLLATDHFLRCGTQPLEKPFVLIFSMLRRPGL
mmetsp:Transcript_21347/g.40174  ORF Transcript_21347/g.40174 Transcript_21347/m.40174 type:complete len:221 (-) Transcript_21347:84-746(-)